VIRSVVCALAISVLVIGTTTASARLTDEKPLLAATPPMGWSSWNALGCTVDENAVRGNADAMVSSGMAAMGYTYVDIDDCWMAPERDAGGRLQADPQRFPGGIKALADYVHAKGLKLGIYASAGTATCQNLPGSLDHESTDAATFAEWGVDLLKYDNCYNPGRPAVERFSAMGNALEASGRDIVYSISDWGDEQSWRWAGNAGGHYWRTFADITDSWDAVVVIVEQQAGLARFSRPHGWNDPDSLEVGNGGMSTDEDRAHVSLWAVLNAPLIAGNDLRSMDATTRGLLTNPEVIAVDQDWGGMQGDKVADVGDLEIWAKPMSTGGAAVVLLNRGLYGTEIAASPAELGLRCADEYNIRDLWAHTTTPTTGYVDAWVPPHAAKMFLVSPSLSPRMCGTSGPVAPSSRNPR
jgi:alpha-galactosidase